MSRVLITGLGGELGTALARRLEADESVEAIVGVDLYPPRRRLFRSEFHRIDPRDDEGMRRVIAAVEPTVLVHLGVYEPYSRSSPASAEERTVAGTRTAVDAAVAAGSLEHIVVRSGIEVYGRRRGAPLRPDELVEPDPTTGFGRFLLEAEQQCRRGGAIVKAPVTALRFATIVGPHIPSPLGRVLRLPVVPFAALSDPAFSVVHTEDVAGAFVAALAARHDGPVNIVGPGAVTASQAARLGGRIPVPVFGLPAWQGAKALSELVGAPVPDHVKELLVRGRTADGSLAQDVLDFRPDRSTPEVVHDLQEWGGVTYLPTPRPPSPRAAA